jgi:hypothetical protein
MNAINELDLQEQFYNMVRRSKAGSVESEKEKLPTSLPAARVFEMNEQGEIVSRPLEKVEYLDSLDGSGNTDISIYQPSEPKSKGGSVSHLDLSENNKAKLINDFVIFGR